MGLRLRNQLRVRPQIPMSGSNLASLDIRMAPRVRVFNRHWHLPESKPIRIGLGILLIALGLLGFLPVLGFWMIPLGLVVISHEFAMARRYRRRTVVWWERRRKPRCRNRDDAGDPA